MKVKQQLTSTSFYFILFNNENYTTNSLKTNGTGRRDVNAISPSPRIFNESNILLTWVFSRSPNSNLGRICVLGFSANRVWLVSRFYIIILLHYYKAQAFSIPMINTLDYVCCCG